MKQVEVKSKVLTAFTINESGKTIGLQCALSPGDTSCVTSVIMVSLRCKGKFGIIDRIARIEGLPLQIMILQSIR